jgi:hypothetical protein
MIISGYATYPDIRLLFERGRWHFRQTYPPRWLKHGVFYTLVGLQAAINRFIKEYNANEVKPFIWRADPDKIIAARNRGFQTSESIH